MNKIKIKPQPGVMVYDDVFLAMSNMPHNDASELLRAMFAYKNSGEEPNFPPYSQLSISWQFIRGKLESDKKKYTDRVLSSKYSNYVKDCKREETPYLSLEDWKQYYVCEFDTAQ